MTQGEINAALLAKSKKLGTVGIGIRHLDYDSMHIIQMGEASYLVCRLKVNGLFMDRNRAVTLSLKDKEWQEWDLRAFAFANFIGDVYNPDEYWRIAMALLKEGGVRDY